MAVATVTHAVVVALALTNGLRTGVWASLLVGGVVVGATNRNARSVLHDGLFAGTFGTVVGVLAWTVLGGWTAMTRLLAEAGIRFGVQYQFVFTGLFLSPVAGLGNAVTASVTASVRRRLWKWVENFRGI